MPTMDRVFIVVLLIVAGCSSSSEPPLTDDPPSRPALDVAGAELSVQLTWQPAPESDFAGYRVYRSRRGSLQHGGGFAPSNSAGPPSSRPRAEEGSAETVLWDEIFVQTDTTWTDEWVSPGHHYVYALTVVDQAGHESDADSVSVTTSIPKSPYIGWEPRRARWSPEEELELNLWVTGTTGLSGVVIEFVHEVPLEDCTSESLFGAETLFLCQTEPREAEVPIREEEVPIGGEKVPIGGVNVPMGGVEVTTVAVSSIRGGPTLTGAGIVGSFRFLAGDAGAVALPISVVAFESADSAPPVVLATMLEIEE